GRERSLRPAVLRKPGGRRGRQREACDIGISHAGRRRESREVPGVRAARILEAGALTLSVKPVRDPGEGGWRERRPRHERDDREHGFIAEGRERHSERAIEPG